MDQNVVGVKFASPLVKFGVVVFNVRNVRIWMEDDNVQNIYKGFSIRVVKVKS